MLQGRANKSRAPKCKYDRGTVWVSERGCGGTAYNVRGKKKNVEKKIVTLLGLKNRFAKIYSGTSKWKSSNNTPQKLRTRRRKRLYTEYTRKKKPRISITEIYCLFSFFYIIIIIYYTESSAFTDAAILYAEYNRRFCHFAPPYATLKLLL